MLPALLLPLACAIPLSAQRPQSAQEALLQYEDVRQQPERNRHAAVRNLGRFQGPSVSAALVEELNAAKTLSYQRTVVRAIGFRPHAGTLDALVAHLGRTEAARLCNAVTDAMVRQGSDGVVRLARQLPENRGHKARLDAICYSLGKVEQGDEARDILLAEIGRVGGGARLAPLRGLAARHDDERVDAVRVQLAGDKAKALAGNAVGQLARHGHPEAGRLAEQFARRIADDDSGDLHAAVALGLLAQPTAANRKLLWRSVARANAPFGADALPLWQRALADEDGFGTLFDGVLANKDADERAVAARALGFVADELRGPVPAMLEKLLADRAMSVVSGACAAVLALADDRADAALEKTLKLGSPAQQAMRLAVIAERNLGSQERFVGLAQTSKAEAAAACLRLLARRFGAAAAAGEVARARLGDRSPEVRVAAIELLRIERSKASIEPMIARLKKEKGRVRADLLAALRDLTGAGFADQKQWRAWWAKEASRFEVRPVAAGSDKARQSKTAATYWDIPVDSERVAFVVDTSGSMKQPFGTGNALRIDEAKRQLTQVFDRLPKGAKVDVVAFADVALVMFGKLQALGRSKRKAADTFVQELVAKGPTDLHEALQRVFELDDVDTVFVLTDGKPSVGAVVDYERLTQEVARWNIGRGIRIHTIAIGGKSELLERLAKESGGQHTVTR